MYPDQHGGLNYPELQAAGIDPHSLIDFSVNSNPFGPSPRLRLALQQVDLASYPDRHVLALGVRLAVLNQVEPEQVLVCNGTAESIWLIAHALLRTGNKVLIASPTFGEYTRASGTVGAQIIAYRAQPPNFRIDPQALIAEITQHRPCLTFLCNPNNPTGQVLSGAVVAQIAAACAPGYLILDEAYRSFVTFDPFSPPPAENVIVLRSMTKDFAIAGLRLGYILAGGAVIEALRAYQPPWSVNSLAQTAGLAALDDLPYYRDTLKQTLEIAKQFQASMEVAGMDVITSQTHFCLVGCGEQTAADVRRKLLGKGILTRDCTSFGLPRHLRIATRLAADNQKFIAAWNENL